MSDTPDYLPPYARSSRGADVPVKSASLRRDDDLEDDPDGDDLDRDDEPAVIAPAERTPVREGLPPSYRMRHELHYVETLVAPPAPSVPTAVVAPAPPVEPATPAIEAAAPEPASNRLDGGAIAALATSIASIHASLADLSLRGRPLRDRVAIDLARAEAARARWTAEAAAVLQTDPLPSLDEVDLTAVCRAVAAAFAPECRLVGGAPTMAMPATTAPVFGDERLLTTAVGALLAAVRALVEDRGDAGRITVAFAPRVDTTSRTVEITQSAVRVPAALLARFFDVGVDGAPGGQHWRAAAGGSAADRRGPRRRARAGGSRGRRLPILVERAGGRLSPPWQPVVKVAPAFGRRCIAPRCVAPPSNTGPYSRSSRLAIRAHRRPLCCAATFTTGC